MFYAKLKQDGKETGVLYEDFQDYISDTFSPTVETTLRGVKTSGGRLWNFRRLTTVTVCI